MSRPSQTEALREMRHLIDTNAGRIQGQSLRYRSHAPIPPGTLTRENAALLHDSVYRERGTPLTGDTIYYVVSCDGTPVAWLTYILRGFANSEASSAPNRRRKSVWSSVAASVAEYVSREDVEDQRAAPQPPARSPVSGQVWPEQVGSTETVMSGPTVTRSSRSTSHRT